MRRLHFVKNVDVVTPMSSKLPCSSPSFCCPELIKGHLKLKRKTFSDKMSIFNHLNKLKPFVPGLAGYGQYVFGDYVFQLFASYPSNGLLVERNDFLL